LAAYNGKLEIFRYLKNTVTAINIPIANNTTLLHLGISIRDT